MILHGESVDTSLKLAQYQQAPCMTIHGMCLSINRYQLLAMSGVPVIKRARARARGSLGLYRARPRAGQGQGQARYTSAHARTCLYKCPVCTSCRHSLFAY